MRRLLLPLIRRAALLAALMTVVFHLSSRAQDADGPGIIETATPLESSSDSLQRAPILFKKTHAPELGLQNRLGDLEIPPGFCCSEPRFWAAAGEIIALQIIPNYFNRNVADDTTAVLSPDSWRTNMKIGFEWDNNNFSTNMFMHPYHGNLFYNSGRSNGYSFWQSSLFAAGGSFLWEMFGENNSAAINDWMMTSMGGITIGEALHRSAIMLRSNEESGTTRSLRELGGFILDPVGSFNRLARGEATKVGPNPPDRRPSSSMVQAEIGLRHVGSDSLFNPKTSDPYIRLIIQAGDWQHDYAKPYDSFQFDTQINFGDKTAVGRFSVDGALWGFTMKETLWPFDPSRQLKTLHSFTLNQIFAYEDNSTFEYGGQFVAAAIHSRMSLSKSLLLNTRFQPMISLLTGINADYDEATGRDYDFGSGAGVKLIAILVFKEKSYLRLVYEGLFTATVNGTRGHHVIHKPAARLRIRVIGDIGVGADYELFVRNSSYDDYPYVHVSNPTFKLSVTLSSLDNLFW